MHNILTVFHAAIFSIKTDRLYVFYILGPAILFVFDSFMNTYTAIDAYIYLYVIPGYILDVLLYLFLKVSSDYLLNCGAMYLVKLANQAVAYYILFLMGLSLISRASSINPLWAGVMIICPFILAWVIDIMLYRHKYTLFKKSSGHSLSKSIVIVVYAFLIGFTAHSDRALEDFNKFVLKSRIYNYCKSNPSLYSDPDKLSSCIELNWHQAQTEVAANKTIKLDATMKSNPILPLLGVFLLIISKVIVDLLTKSSADWLAFWKIVERDTKQSRRLSRLYRKIKLDAKIAVSVR